MASLPPGGGKVQKVIDLLHLGFAVRPTQPPFQLCVGVGVGGVVVDHVLHRGHCLRGQLAHAVVVLCDGGRDLADHKRRLTHVKPGGGLLQPENR